MPTVITARDAEELLRHGEAPPPGAVLTPSARDVLAGRLKPTIHSMPSSAPAVAAASGPWRTPDYEFRWQPGADPRTAAGLARFFASPAIEELKARMCDIGRR